MFNSMMPVSFHHSYPCFVTLSSPELLAIAASVYLLLLTSTLMIVLTLLVLTGVTLWLTFKDQLKQPPLSLRAIYSFHSPLGNKKENHYIFHRFKIYFSCSKTSNSYVVSTSNASLLKGIKVKPPF